MIKYTAEKKEIGCMQNSSGNIEKLNEKAKVVSEYNDENEKLVKNAQMLNLDINDYLKAYKETGDQLTAQLQAQERTLLSKKISDTITLNGNIIPEEIYSQISQAAQAAISFKYNRFLLVKAISSLEDDDFMALSTIQIAQLLINTEPEDKALFTDDDKDLINDLCRESRLYEARKILRFLESKRLSTKENTDLYNRILNCVRANYDYSLLLTENETLLRTNSQYTENKKRDDDTTPDAKGNVKKLEFQNPKRNRVL